MVVLCGESDWPFCVAPKLLRGPREAKPSRAGRKCGEDGRRPDGGAVRRSRAGRFVPRRNSFAGLVRLDRRVQDGCAGTCGGRRTSQRCLAQSDSRRNTKRPARLLGSWEI